MVRLARLVVIGCLWSGSAWAQPAADHGRGKPENTKGACTDRIDNDMDGHVDCDDQDCQDLVICAPAQPRNSAGHHAVDEDGYPVRGIPLSAAELAPNVAERRGKATTKLVAGAVMLPLGFLIAGASGAAYYYSTTGGDNQYQGLIGAGAAMDVVGLGLMAAGAAMLAIGAGQLAATAPTKAAWIRPSMSFGAGSVLVGLGGSY